MKVEVQSHKTSIHEMGLTLEQEAIIWDFYVTRAIAESASQRRKASDYGYKELPWKEMKQCANIATNNIKILLATTINKTLSDLDLETTEGKGDKKRNKPIEIDFPKIACITPFAIADEDKPKGRVGEAESVLTHIRNSLAHGLTYYFANGNVLFEDKDRQKTTARIILNLQTLLDWIKIIDKDERFYILHN